MLAVNLSVLAAVSALQALTLGLLWRLIAGRYRGLGHWLWASAMFAAGFGLIGLGGAPPSWLAAAGYGALAGGAALILMGLNRFVGRPRPRQERAAAPIVALAMLQPVLPAAGAAAIGALSLLCAWSLARATPPELRASHRFAAVVFALNGAWLILRAGLADSQLVGALTFLGALAAALLWVAGAAAMVVQRLLHDVRVTQAAVADDSAARRRAEQLKALILRTIPDPFWFKDVSGRYLLWSDSFLAFYGLAPEQLAGKRSREVFPPELAERMEASDAHVLSTREPFCQETVALNPRSGRPRWTENSKSLVYEADGRPLGVVGVARDITARKEAEEALRRSSARLELALWGAELGLWDWHIPSGAMETNRQLAGLIGLSEEGLAPVVEVWNRHTHPDDLPITKAAFAAVIAGRADFVDVEFRVRHADGGWRWNYARGRAVERDEEGRAVRLIGVTRDITARKEAEEALRRRIDELVALNQIAQALSTWTNLAEGLAAVTPLLMHLFGVETVTVWEYDPAGGQLLALSPQPAGWPRPALPVSDAGPALLEQPGVSVISLGARHPLLGEDGPGAPRRALLVPLRARNAVVGLLCLSAGGPDMVFTPDAVALAQTVGGLLASAVENARLFTAAEAAAAGRERRAIARELHDSVSQALYAANVAAETVPVIWELDPEEGRERLQELRSFTQAALAEMRALLVELRPHTLVDAPLHETLRLLVPTARARGEVDVATAFDPAPLLPPAVQVALYRIAQEALNNVCKHANASQLRLSLAVSPPAAPGAPWAGAVTVAIVDNGRGCVPDVAGAGHMGVAMMRERAAEVGARLTINSPPGAGTEIRVEWRGAERLPEEDARPAEQALAVER